MIPQVHMPPSPTAQLRNTVGRAYPLTFPPEVIKPDLKRSERVVRYLDVRRSPRYRAANGQTFCNIYAYDYCCGMGVYLPRVWWGQDALAKLGRGESTSPVYGASLFELNANALYDWLTRWGTTYGWEFTSFTEGQHNANLGGVAVICGKRLDLKRSGHIAVIVPEGAYGKAKRGTLTDVVLAPLQCQAGAVNKEYWDGAGWWDAKGLYEGVGCWQNMSAAPTVQVAS